jgi:very-short-patch-repair endonuclease
MRATTFMRKRTAKGSSPEVASAAQRLRKQMTPAEACLWQALRNYQLEGLKFRRQHPLAGFVLDFYCPALRLVIEVDGEIHQQQHEADTARTEKLQHLGCTVLRFSNDDVLANLNTVLTEIAQATHQITLLLK